jgi:L-tartrate/succinate antiporter
VKQGAEVPAWAAQELDKMGPLSSREITLAVLVISALLLWIFGGKIMEATTAAIVVISLMLILNVLTWDDITANKSAWNTLVWFATLVALADGLTRVGFIKWFAESVAG